MKKFAFGCGGIIAIIVVILVIVGFFLAGSYNRLVKLDQSVNQTWAQVQNVYQRRADLIPNLVNTVQGAANFEKSTLIAVTQARASVGRVQIDPNKAPTDAAAIAAVPGRAGTIEQRALALVGRQRALSRAAGKRRISSRSRRNWKERRTESRSNAAISTRPCRATTRPCAPSRRTFSPACWDFQPRPFFNAQPGAEKAPNVKFDFGNSPAPAMTPAAAATP